MNKFVGWDSLPDDCLTVCLAVVGARDLAAACCASRRLNRLANEDALWRALVLTGPLGRLAALLDAAPAPPAWWAGRTYKQRLAALCSGASFEAQVYNREQENELEDFALSSYDASLTLSPESVRALLADDPSQPVLFQACYLPMGQMPAVMEAGVAQERLRLAPTGSLPFDVFGAGSAPPAGLAVGEEVEVQWKGRRSHPWGWWFGTVQSVRGNRITLVFRQYPSTSVWHRVKAPIKPGRAAVLNGDCSFGYIGGLRRLTAEEKEEWRRHGAPHPPAPEQLQALEAAADDEEEEEVWSDDEEDEDEEEEGQAELAAGQAAEMHGGQIAPAGEGDLAAAVAADDDAGPAAPEAPVAGAAAAVAATAPAVHVPAAPPGQPVQLQLGPAVQVAVAPAAAADAELPAAALDDAALPALPGN